MSAETYSCNRCGVRVGIAGENTGSDDDYAAEESYAADVEFHESGECVAIPVNDITELAAVPDPRAEYVAGLRALADLLEQHPDLPLPYEDKFSWNVWPHETADVKAEISRIRRLLPGRFDKRAPDSEYAAVYFTLTGHLRGLTLEIATYRDQVCERVVTGQREVTTEVPTATETVTVTEDIVEWRCHPLLAEDRESETVPA